MHHCTHTYLLLIQEQVLFTSITNYPAAAAAAVADGARHRYY